VAWRLGLKLSTPAAAARLTAAGGRSTGRARIPGTSAVWCWGFCSSKIRRGSSACGCQV